MGQQRLRMTGSGDDPLLAHLDAMADELRELRESIDTHEREQNPDVVALPRMLVGAAITLMVAAIVGLWGVALDVHSIEQTRFTREDGERMRREIQRDIAPDIERRLREHERRLDNLESEHRGG